MKPSDPRGFRQRETLRDYVTRTSGTMIKKDNPPPTAARIGKNFTDSTNPLTDCGETNGDSSDNESGVLTPTSHSTVGFQPSPSMSEPLLSESVAHPTPSPHHHQYSAPAQPNVTKPSDGHPRLFTPPELYPSYYSNLTQKPLADPGPSPRSGAPEASCKDFTADYIPFDLLSAQLKQSPDPTQLPNGKWKCNHLCNDKNTCHHLCCREGLDKKPRPPKAVQAKQASEPQLDPSLGSSPPVAQSQGSDKHHLAFDVSHFAALVKSHSVHLADQDRTLAAQDRAIKSLRSENTVLRDICGHHTEAVEQHNEFNKAMVDYKHLTDELRGQVKGLAEKQVATGRQDDVPIPSAQQEVGECKVQLTNVRVGQMQQNNSITAITGHVGALDKLVTANKDRTDTALESTKAEVASLKVENEALKIAVRIADDYSKQLKSTVNGLEQDIAELRRDTEDVAHAMVTRDGTTMIEALNELRYEVKNTRTSEEASSKLGKLETRMKEMQRTLATQKRVQEFIMAQLREEVSNQCKRADEVVAITDNKHAVADSEFTDLFNKFADVQYDIAVTRRNSEETSAAATPSIDNGALAEELDQLRTQFSAHKAELERQHETQAEEMRLELHELHEAWLGLESGKNVDGCAQKMRELKDQIAAIGKDMVKRNALQGLTDRVCRVETSVTAKLDALGDPNKKLVSTEAELKKKIQRDLGEVKDDLARKTLGATALIGDVSQKVNSNKAEQDERLDAITGQLDGLTADVENQSDNICDVDIKLSRGLRSADQVEEAVKERLVALEAAREDTVADFKDVNLRIDGVKDKVRDTTDKLRSKLKVDLSELESTLRRKNGKLEQRIVEVEDSI